MNTVISVIIPTSNRPLCILERAVKSVLNQTYPQIEIVIVDDNYNDLLLSKSIQNFCIQNALIYCQTYGVGAAAARNFGVFKSTGAFIAFLDDDDEWFTEKLSLQYQLFKTSDIGLVYCRGLTIKLTDNGELVGKYATDNYFKTAVVYEDLLYKNYIGTTTQIIVTRIAFYAVNGFDESFPARQDYDLCLRISQKFKCVGVDKHLFIHYLHSNNQISANFFYGMQGYKKIAVHYKKDLKRVPDAYRCACYRVANSAFLASKYSTFIWYTIQAIISNPLKYRETLKKCFKSNK